MTDPLEKLFVSSEELDRELLTTVLTDLAQIDRDSGEIRFTSKAVRLPKKLQILIYLMSRKAARAYGVISEELISPKELASKLGIGGSSLRGQLSDFTKERLVESKSGKHWVPNYAIERVKELLEQARGKEK